jgi:thiol-disulfide isomerase/thioredoxin
MIISKLYRSALIVFAVSLSLSNTTIAQEQSGKEILQKAVNHATSMSAFTADFEIVFTATVDGQNEDTATDYTVAVKQPESAVIHMSSPQMELHLYTSDKETTRYLPELNQYIVEPRMTPVADLYRAASNNITLPAMAIFAELVKDAPLAAVLSGEKPITLVGQETVNDIPCDRVKFEYADFSCEVWIAQGAKPLIHRIKPDLALMKEGFIKQGINVESFDVDLNVLHWQPNMVKDNALKYSPAADAELVTQFYRPEPASPAMALIGQEAPSLDLKLLDGTSFSVASKKGNEIVVLDFWASWCGPCRMGMPILSKVVNEFEDKGVRLYAVNLNEGPDEINPFLESTGLDITVVLDTEGALGNAYLAESIPQMVIIGRDGIVKKVHTGVTPNYEEDIRAEFIELTK